MDTRQTEAFRASQLQSALQKVDAESVEPFIGIVNRAQAMRTEFRAEAQRLRDEGRLTEQGIAEVLRERAQSYQQEAATLKSTVLEPRAAKLAHRLMPEVSATDDAHRDERLTNYFVGLKGNQRIAALTRCLTGQDKELTEALLRNARFVNLTADSMQRLRMTLAPAEAEGDLDRLTVARLAEESLDQVIQEISQ